MEAQRYPEDYDGINVEAPPTSRRSTTACSTCGTGR